MTLTKEQVIQKFLPRALIKRRNNIVWGDVVSAVASSPAVSKEAIVNALKGKEYANAGRILSEILMAALSEEVQNNLNSALADNRLSLAELSDIFE